MEENKEKSIIDEFCDDYVFQFDCLFAKEKYQNNVAFISVFIGQDGKMSRCWNIPVNMAAAVMGALEYTKIEIMDETKKVKVLPEQEEKDESEA